MTICFFGMYAPKYTRNRILLKGLSENKVNVIQCNDRSHFVWGMRYFKLLYKFFLLKAWKADNIFVGFPGQTDVPLAWALSKMFRKKVIFDAFYSLYVSQVFDRKRVPQNSLRARGYFLIDRLSCFLADKIILDTNAHIDYFVQTFHIPKNKFSRVLVGTDNDVIKPRRVKSHSGFVVGFHGSFLPLQGVPVILKAAKLLQKNRAVQFKLVGNGIELAKCRQIVQDEQISNVEFLKEIPYETLSVFISGTDVYLGGPFGNSLKSNQVIPNKVYEAMACQKPVIVGDSQATKELFRNKTHCLFVDQGNPKKLAGAILELRDNFLLREKIASEGYNLIRKELTPKKIVRGLISTIEAS